MAKLKSLKPVAATVGAAVLASAFAAPVFAADNPFASQQLKSGFNLAGAEGSCKGEGSCKDKGKGEGACKDEGKGEGSCKDKGKGEGSCSEGSCKS